MAAFELGFDGLRDGGTFKLASATKGTIASNPNQIKGKVVTITGDYEVGYGTDTNVPLGVVTAVEPDVGGSENLLVTVAWGQTFENIPCTSGDAAGNYLLCDGKGGLKKTTSTVSNCKALGVSGKIATIKID